ncbi:undecaprenyl diphosphate synthase family protein [Candidatus Pacearchaeota archaeon]|nr:undecaprenyl diphosphate synthase family protein [Candidatus Pacearchaeota archaeon]
MAILKHVAIGLDNISDWCSKNNASLNSACEKYFKNLKGLMELQARSDIPIFTIYLLPDNIDKLGDDYLAYSDFIAGFFSELLNNPMLSEQKIKISIFGKWYRLPGKAVEALKEIIEATKDYDRFFANFCINYDGQEEIVDACRLIAKQVQLGKIDPEMITKESIKENIYSSYFLPPDVVFIYGERRLSSLLLWDSAYSSIVFANKPFMEFEEGDLIKITD